MQREFINNIVGVVYRFISLSYNPLMLMWPTVNKKKLAYSKINQRD